MLYGPYGFGKHLMLLYFSRCAVTEQELRSDFDERQPPKSRLLVEGSELMSLSRPSDDMEALRERTKSVDADWLRLQTSLEACEQCLNSTQTLVLPCTQAAGELSAWMDTLDQTIMVESSLHPQTAGDVQQLCKTYKVFKLALWHNCRVLDLRSRFHELDRFLVGLLSRRNIILVTLVPVVYRFSVCRTRTCWMTFVILLHVFGVCFRLNAMLIFSFIIIIIIHLRALKKKIIIIILGWVTVCGQVNYPGI